MKEEVERAVRKKHNHKVNLFYCLTYVLYFQPADKSKVFLLSKVEKMWGLNRQTYFIGAVQYYMGQSDQAEDKWTFRGRECDEGLSERAREITRIGESKRMTKMEKIGQ